MAKFIYDTSENSPFQGLRVFAPDLESGIKFAKKNDVTALAIWPSDDYSGRMVINLDFLKDLRFVVSFEVIVPVSKKSDIQGIYELRKLRNLRWAIDCDLMLNFDRLPNIEVLSISYSPALTNWDSLIELRELQISDPNCDDLRFLSGLSSLRSIRIIGGKISSLRYLENCTDLEYVFCQRCRNLVQVEETLSKLPNLKGICFEGCRNVSLSDHFLSKWGKSISII